MPRRFSIIWLIALIISMSGFLFSALPAKAAQCCFCYACDEYGCTDPALDLDDGEIIYDPENCGGILSTCSMKESPECSPATTVEKPKFTTFAEEFQIKDMILGVAIPSLKFSSPPSEVDENGKIYIPWLAEYLKAIYNYGVVMISIVGVVAVIIQGIRIITSAGGPAKTDAYKKITQIFIGLFIAWGSYVILYTINPGMTAFKPLEIQYIETQALDENTGTVDDDVDLTAMANEPLPASSGQPPAVAGQPTVAAGETPYAKLKSVCVSGPLSEASLHTILPTWVEIGRNGGAVYVRGGHTSNKGCKATGAQTNWMVNWFLGTTIPFPNPYGLTKESIKNLTEEQQETLKEDKNYNAQLIDVYNNQALVNYTGRMCGDCGTWILQLYKCAGLKGIAIPQLKTKAEAPYFLAGSKEMSCSQAITQVKGGLKFGDVFWSQGVGHWFMYTGGVGLSYEIVEMGGGNSATCKNYGPIPVIDVTPGTCVRTARTVSDYWIIKNPKKDKGCFIYRFIGIAK